MKIRALRVRNVGRFVAPVAVEGLTGTLDILADDNEAGKSTLFRAIEAVFQVRHTATGAAVERLKPYAGGEPLIEADFDTEAGRFRIRKQYGRGKSAELLDLGAGTSLARGVEAEDRLAQLVGGEDGTVSRLGLLWVGQRRSLDPADPDFDKERGERNLLLSVVGREIAAVTSGDEARLVKARVAELLAPLSGGRQGQPKTGSPFDQSLKERDRLVQSLAEARAAAELTAARTARLAALASARADRLGAESLARLTAEAAAARQAHEAARAARERLAVAERDLAEATGAEREAALALGAFDQSLAALAVLDAEIAGARAAVAEAERTCRDADARARAAQAALAAGAAEERRLSVLVSDHDAAERRAGIAGRLEVASRAQGAAEALAVAVATAAERLGGNGVTADAMRAIEAAEREVTRLSDRQVAAAPTIAIALEAGGVGRVSAGGEVLATDRTFVAVEPLTVLIPGIGTIAVSPAETADGAETARRLAAARAARAKALGAAGVASFAEAESRRAERDVAERALDMARAALAQAAPEGIEALAAEVARLHRLHAESAQGAALADRAAVVAELNAVAAQRLDAEAARDAAATAAAAAQQALARASALAGEREARRRKLDADLPPEAMRASERARLQAAAAAAAEVARRATREALALRESAPSDARLAALADAARRSAAALEATMVAAQNNEQELRELEARLDEAGEAGGGARVAAIEGALERAEADVRRFETERRALSLIAEALRSAEAELRHRFERPVVERLAPYLSTAFAGAELRFGAGFRAAELVRAGVVEPIERLSDGTREQIAVLVRLAFGRLLAEAGHPAPVILDDALVYSDDRRIRSMFRALEVAAESHQVIVLTCRAGLFADLAGHRLSVAPWHAA